MLADGRLGGRSNDDSCSTENGTIKLLPTEGKGEPVVLLPGSADWSLADKRLRDRDKSKAVLADGRLATAGKDGKIKIWRKNVKGTMRLAGEKWRWSRWAAAGRFRWWRWRTGGLASVGEDGKIKRWSKDFTDEPEIISVDPPLSSAVLPDGRLAEGGFDGNITLSLTDNSTVRNGDPLVLFHIDIWYGGSSGHEVRALAVLPDGRLASGSYDTIKLWPTGAAGEPVVLPHDSDGAVTSLAVLLDGRWLASGDQDGTIKLWPIGGTGDPVVLPHDSEDGAVTSLAALPDGRLASGGQDGTIKLWREDGARQLVAVLRNGSPVSLLAALPDGRLASGSRDDDGNGTSKSSTIKVWSKDDASYPVAVLHLNFLVELLVALPDGRLAIGGRDGRIELWRTDAAGEPLVLSPGSPNNFEAVQSLAVVADGWLASGGEDGTIKLWPIDGAGAPVVLSQGSSSKAFSKVYGGVRSLAVLPGRVAGRRRRRRLGEALVHEGSG